MLPISVIIPCYNSSKTIERAVNSVLLQTMLPKEIILIDDCSLDGGDTLKILYNIRDSNRTETTIIVLSFSINQGAATARNVGWKQATQKYIAFLDSDDIWHKKKLEIQYNWMSEHEDVLLTGHGYEKVNSIEMLNNKEMEIEKIAYIKKVILFKNYFATRTIMLKNEIPYRFEEGKRYSEDYLLWLQIVLNSKTALLKIPLAGVFKADYGEDGLSAQLWRMEKGEIATYVALYDKKQISIIMLFVLINWSMAKYLLRVLKVRL